MRHPIMMPHLSSAHDMQAETGPATYATLSGDPPAVVSALAGLSLQQLLDVDVELLAVKIDQHQSQTKKAVLVRMMVTGIPSCAHGEGCDGVSAGLLALQVGSPRPNTTPMQPLSACAGPLHGIKATVAGSTVPSCG